MPSRRSLLSLLALPLLALPTSCAGEAADPSEPSSGESALNTAAEREWFLSTPEQQEDYCTSYRQGDDSLRSVRHYGFDEDDAGQEFVEEFLKLLKRKC